MDQLGPGCWCQNEVGFCDLSGLLCVLRLLRWCSRFVVAMTTSRSTNVSNPTPRPSTSSHRTKTSNRTPRHSTAPNQPSPSHRTPRLSTAQTQRNGNTESSVFHTHATNKSLLHLIKTDYIGASAMDPYVGLATPPALNGTRQLTYAFHRNHFAIVYSNASIQLGRILSVHQPHSPRVNLHLYGSIDTGPWFQRVWQPISTINGDTVIGHAEVSGSRPCIINIAKADVSFVFDNLIANRLPSNVWAISMHFTRNGQRRERLVCNTFIKKNKNTNKTIGTDWANFYGKNPRHDYN